MTEAELETFRLRFHLSLVERLAVKTAFLASHLQGILTVAATHQGLQGWLDTSSAEALRVYGEALGDPGLTALYAGEAEEIAEAMKKRIAKIAVEAEKAFGP